MQQRCSNFAFNRTSSSSQTFPWIVRLCKLGVGEVQVSAEQCQPVDVPDLMARLTSDIIGDVLVR